MDHDESTSRTGPAKWAEALDESDAELAAGQTVPLQPLLDELRHAAQQLEQRLEIRSQHIAEPDRS